MLQHASYDYPTEWVPLLEILLTLLVAGWWWLGRGRPPGRLGRWWRHLAVRPGRMLAGLFLAGFLGNALITWVQGFPVPWVSDELSYLYAADTFAHGRVVNPVHPMAPHFTPEHVLVTEHGMASKYPPGQGLVLALGQVLGEHPGVGLWLLAGLLPAVVAWALAGWLPRCWALVGGLVVLLRLGIGSYWQQSYWGGGLAALGGALLLGACGRMRGGSWRLGTTSLASIGLVLLLNTRPFEGILLALGLASGVAGRLWHRGLPARWPIHGLLAALVLGSGLGVMLAYNQAITGDPFVFPHALYAQQGGPQNFVWQLADPGDDRSDPSQPAPVGRWLPFALADGLRDLGSLLAFVLGATLYVPLVAALALGGRRFRSHRSLRVVAPAIGLVVLGHAVTTPWLAHYSAPLVAPLVLVACEALRWLARRWGGGARMALGVLVVQAVLFVVQLPAHRADADDWSHRRHEVDRQLRAEPGRHLLVVSYPRGRDLSWSWNGADLETERVVWADSLGPEADARLLAAFAGRRVWRLVVDFEHRPEPIPLGPEAMSLPSVEPWPAALPAAPPR